MPQQETGTEQKGAGELFKRRTTMPDGRYLIYYTFGQSGAPETHMSGAVQSETQAGAQPEAQPVAEEERRV